jgi:hypothetical protein
MHKCTDELAFHICGDPPFLAMGEFIDFLHSYVYKFTHHPALRLVAINF